MKYWYIYTKTWRYEATFADHILSTSVNILWGVLMWLTPADDLSSYDIKANVTDLVALMWLTQQMACDNMILKLMWLASADDLFLPDSVANVPDFSEPGYLIVALMWLASADDMFLPDSVANVPDFSWPVFTL